MGKLAFTSPADDARALDELIEPFARRVESMPPGTCPLAVVQGTLQACAAQTCGKCTPCREGLARILENMSELLAFEGDSSTVDDIRRRATLLRDTADCAIGWHAGALALQALDSFEGEFASHAERGACAAGVRQTVPCVTQCPAHVNVPAYIALVQEGDCDGAVKMIRKDNPFPTACAFVCEHPCEQRCRRTVVDAPLNIRGIKKYAVENAPADTVAVPERAPSTGKRVAVIGAGPSGLTCAYYLAIMGHDVTVFEERKQLGGMMRYGIPAYRFPRERIDEDIRAILSVGGIEVQSEHKVDDAEMRRIADEFDAVYVAVGAQGGKKLDIEGVDAQGVMSAVELLERIGDEDYPDFTGKKVAVIGGGNVAMDCARTAVRAGGEVTVAYRRRLEDMTALPDEVHAALAEGVEMMTLFAPVRIEADEAWRARALVCQPQRIGPVKRGRPAPIEANAAEARIPADVVLIAVGQEIQSAPFEEFGMQAERTRFVADKFLRAVGHEGEGVFVGGDCQVGPKTVIMAIAAGKVAARNIDDYLGFSHEIDCGAVAPAPRPNDRAEYGRVNLAERPARERARDFEASELSMSAEEAAQECGRCLRCDAFGIGALTGRGLESW